LDDEDTGASFDFDGVAGHSLGGAMATLAAYDLASLRKPEALNVYVYGCPRTGNHAFANDYRIRVPNTWQVMTDRVRSPQKFVSGFHGKMVSIDPQMPFCKPWLKSACS
jgi:predicted lipase